MHGKEVRLARLLKNGRTVIVPMDHGVSMGPAKGLEDLAETVRKVAEGGATAYICHKGMVPHVHRGDALRMGLIVHVNGSTALAPDPNAKRLVATVEEALRLGADGVSYHINFGSATEAEMVEQLGRLSTECANWGLPLLAMAYPRGPNIKNPYDVSLVKHAARAAAELGADIVKTLYTGSVESFREVVRSCPVPVVIAGGERMDSDETLYRMVEDAMKAGAAGVSIGRNVFQAPDVAAATRALADIVLRKGGHG